MNTDKKTVISKLKVIRHQKGYDIFKYDDLDIDITDSRKVWKKYFMPTTVAVSCRVQPEKYLNGPISDGHFIVRDILKDDTHKGDTSLNTCENLLKKALKKALKALRSTEARLRRQLDLTCSHIASIEELLK